MVPLDDPVAMSPLGATPVADPSDRAAVKAAIDAVYAALHPDYLMILGSTDVVPHQELSNPMYVPGVDEDRTVPSDLPYACDAPYAARASDFRGPTRVVGRLPDVTGGTDPAYLENLLATAAGWLSRPPGAYQSYFAVTAQDWQAVTAESLTWVFGDAAALSTCPSMGPAWPAAQLAPLSHYVNCHGLPSSSAFYGSPPAFPLALDAALLAGAGLIQPGTVAVAECCYGAELYDPGGPGNVLGIANTYLREGAYAFFASSCVSYGAEVDSGGSSLIARAFAHHVTEGASTGRAALQARQDFVAAATLLSPVDLKTLAQFNLLGDPSIHPATPGGGGGAGGVLAIKSAAGRSLRRDRLARLGAALAAVTPFAAARSAATTGISRRVRAAATEALNAMGAIAGTTGRGHSIYVVRWSARGTLGIRSAAARASLPRRLHLAMGALNPADDRIRRRVVVLAHEGDGGEVVCQRYFGR